MRRVVNFKERNESGNVIELITPGTRIIVTIRQKSVYCSIFERIQIVARTDDSKGEWAFDDTSKELEVLLYRTGEEETNGGNS
jgi:hypothetical protein